MDGQTLLDPTVKLFIDGALTDAEGGRVYDVINPATEAIAGVAADAAAADADRAIAAARRAFDETDWSTNTERRLTALRQFRDELKANLPQLRLQVATETGCPPGLSYGPQVDGPTGAIDFVLDTLAAYQFEHELPDLGTMGGPARRLVRREAAGVVAAITPWNFPLQLNLTKSIPALAAGCTVVLKAAPETPWSASFLGRIAAACPALPPGVFNVLTAADKEAVGSMLSSDPRIDAVSFTGSTPTGRRVMQAAAATIKKTFLELGGKSAYIVLDDADFATALPAAAMVCYHAGQGCAIPTRLLVPRARHDEALRFLLPLFQNFPYGDRSDMTQIMGPLISAAQRDRVLGFIARGVAEGARLLAGGGRPRHLEKGYYVEPTLFAGVTNEMTIAREEIFGPVLAVMAYEDEDDAVRIANDSIYGLSGSIASASTARALNLAKRIRTGTMSINGANFYAPNAPFGGYKQSGIGREMGREGFEEYLEIKTIALPA